MRVLVTGGTGFTGGHLCRRLVAEGHQVRTIARQPDKATDLARLGVEVIPGDVVDAPVASKATRGVEHVYHIAAIYRQEGLPLKTFWDVNVRGTENLLTASQTNGVARFIHCSTVGVHGAIKKPPANEEAPYSPGDHYQESKLEGEKVALTYMRQNQMAVTVFRPAPIYGPGDLRFLKLFKGIYKGRFRMIGSGNVFYHLVYIDDLIDGILLCGTKEEAVGNTYIIAGGGYVTLNTLVSLIAEALSVPRPNGHIPLWPVYLLAYGCELVCKPLGVEPPLFRRRVDFFKKNRAFDASKAHNDLGFQPKVNLKQGLRTTAEWYINNGYL